jgi:hypothetical protein
MTTPTTVAGMVRMYSYIPAGRRAAAANWSSTKPSQGRYGSLMALAKMMQKRHAGCDQSCMGMQMSVICAEDADLFKHGHPRRRRHRARQPRWSTR